jgi:hypothetical protein
MRSRSLRARISVATALPVVGLFLLSLNITIVGKYGTIGGVPVPVIAVDTSTTQDENNDLDSFQFKYKDAMTRFLLPDWLDKFLKSQPTATHNETLSDPNAKFIVMTCFKYKTSLWEACGGLSDRIFLLPYYIWLANKTGRKLLIKYGKPHPMEEFFVPPEGGFDWRLPDGYLNDEWEAYSKRSWNEMRWQRRAK